MKSTAIKALIIIIAIAVGVYVVLNMVTSKRSKVEVEKINAMKKLKIEQDISEMVDKYDAVTDWESIFDEKNTFKPVYTIQIQDALLKTNGRPILFYASVVDILRRDNQHIVLFENWAWLDVEPWFTLKPTIYFELQCNEELTKKLLDTPLTLPPLFGAGSKLAVVAQIEEVRKHEFALKAYPRGDEEVEIDVEASDIFIAIGKCLDFLYVEEI